MMQQYIHTFCSLIDLTLIRITSEITNKLIIYFFCIIYESYLFEVVLFFIYFVGFLLAIYQQTLTTNHAMLSFSTELLTNTYVFIVLIL